MDITFTNPVYLWTLLIIPFLVVLYFISVRYTRAMTLKFANFVALSRVTGGVKETPSITVLVVRMVSLSLVILSISGLVFWYEGETSQKDYVLAIDASASMMNDDFYPTRLDAAKVAAKDFVDKLPVNAKIGVISFAGVSFVDQPLTVDKGFAKSAIDGIQAKTTGGTDFSNAIITGSNILLPSKKAKTIILLTDGRSNIGLAEEVGIVYAIDQHVVVNTIGIGSKEVSDDFELGVDEESLNEIANYTKGGYYFAENAQDLGQVYDNIIKDRKFGLNPVDLSFPFLIISLVLLLIDWFLGNTIYRRLPQFH